MGYIESAKYLSERFGGIVPSIVIVCGSGLSHLSGSLKNTQTIKYNEIPGFCSTTVAGHSGELVFGYLNGICCVCLRGRFHYYEGNDMSQVVFPIRVMRLLGVKMMIATNAAGGLNENYSVGDVVCIQDHFGGPVMMGLSPLRGPNDPILGPRFPPVSDAFDEHLQNLVIEVAKKLKLSDQLRLNGCYCFTSGPSYESMAESKFLRSIGGDCVGMSTVPEVVAARHCGMKIMCLSIITNKVVLSRRKDTIHASHEEVLEAAAKASQNVQSIVEELVQKSVIGKYLLDIPAAPSLESIIAKHNIDNNSNAATLMVFGIAMPFICSLIFNQ